jgi:hypothetical protein
VPLDRVRAALLHAMMLELRGLADADIATVLDDAFRDTADGDAGSLVIAAISALRRAEDAFERNGARA